RGVHRRPRAAARAPAQPRRALRRGGGDRGVAQPVRLPAGRRGRSARRPRAPRRRPRPDRLVNDRIDQFERTNRAFWDDDADDYQAAHHADISDAAWGAYRIPEAELQILGDLAGLDVLELGCGGAQASLALARSAGGSFGLDLSIGQL